MYSSQTSTSERTQSRRDKKMKTKTELLEKFPKASTSLHFARQWIKEIEKEVSSDVEKKKIGRTSAERYEKLFDLTVKNEKATMEIIADQVADDKGCEITMKYFRALTEDGKNTPTAEGYNFDCLTLLRVFFWNYTDVSLEFCAKLGSTNAFPLFVADLKTFLKDVANQRTRKHIILPCIATLYNCAKAPENKRLFKEAAAVDALVPYTKCADEKIKVNSMLALAYIIEEKDNEIVSSDLSMIKFLLQYLKNAVNSSDHQHEGFSALELVSGVMHLASNDEQDKNKTHIVNEGVLPMLKELMQKGDESEKDLSAKTVWALSFSDDNKKKITQDAELMAILKDMDEKPGAAKKNASGALWVLVKSLTSKTVGEKNEVSHHRKDLPAMLKKENAHQSKQGSTVPKHIMISYQWDSQDLIKKIKQRLTELNYQVWLDIDKMEGSTLGAMAEAVENSVVVLICPSQKYKDSNNCRTEAEYAFQLKKEVIPLLVEPNYQPDGWLGALQGTKLYYDFTNPVKFEDVFLDLVKKLGNKGKTDMDVIDGPSALKTRKSASLESVKHWSRDRVKEWAISHKISSEEIRSLDGKELVFLHDLRENALDSFYKHVSNDLKLSNTRDLANLCDGLKELTL